MKRLNIISIKLPKQQLERAVKLSQLYAGSIGTVNIKDTQRLYDNLKKVVTSIADKLGMDVTDVFEQVSKEAQKRGKIIPIPAKDI
jgi:hypothetical protein